ncbi:uncharacterized protein LOC143204504 [Rhynchophorus ferrugineus]|uniref:Uncharacterized protein n=1 Tax=Rhynchophorus ferrugineus TaxID=354439 RepID=A0A834IP57_RHYFE|nr:hypothetical protein GWI33_005004 [Rhynchophorus ferrugineus]
MKFLGIIMLASLWCDIQARPGGAAALIAPLAPGALLKAPSTAAQVVGPDGSSIAAAVDGGAVAAAPTAGGAVAASVAPGFIAAPALALAAPRVVVAGASGTVISSGLGYPLGGLYGAYGYY